MQIVRELGGYSFGRSDLVRRAMSKKKASVMAKERRNFVYGNEEEHVPGCVSRGIDEKTANKIFDSMMSFAEYAFNKAHSTSYAVVTYQTAWLKYYYPVEFMAALMTSVIDNPGKVAEYIMVSRNMGIRILPPDVNESRDGFSVSYQTDESGKQEGMIRYALGAIKSVGHPVIQAILAEREKGGRYTDLNSFARRVSPEVNKKAAENFIKAGAFDSLGGSRRQMMLVYGQVFDSAARERKSQLTGQMSLFDYFAQEGGEDFDPGVPLPDVPEYDQEQLLAFEKEVLGIYASGHPLERFEALWRKNITALSSDFAINDETGQADRLADQSAAVIGGIVGDITVKYTKNSKTMAFLQVEDLVGSVEVLVFPRVYEKYRSCMNTEERLFISGRVSLEDNKPAKLLADRVWRFSEVPQGLWLKFPTVEAYAQKAQEVSRILLEGQNMPEAETASLAERISIFAQEPRSIKNLAFDRKMYLPEAMIRRLEETFGEENVSLTPGKLRTGDQGVSWNL